MDGFQTTVLGVALALLIIILAVVGVVLSTNTKNALFPPTSLPCPNYWQMNSDGTCAIPVAQTAPNGVNKQYAASYVPVNMGSWDKSNTPGLDSTKSNINFSDNGWGANAGSATCAKKKWANKAGILWDGVSNYNGCA